MNASEVMTENVITVRPTDAIEHAVHLMLENHVSGLPVIDESRHVVGIVSEGDFLRRAETKTAKHRMRWVEMLLRPGRAADEYVRTHGRQVAEIMSPDVVTVTEHTPLSDVVGIMESHGIKRVPVVREGTLVGIVTRANVMHAVAALQRTASAPAASDTAIRRRIVEEIRRQPWGPVHSVVVIVRDGIVDMWGTIADERARRALHVIVENAPGAREMHDHILWVDPMSGVALDPPKEQSAGTPALPS